MPKLIAPAACVLALITGIWVGQAYTLFAPLEPIATDDPRTKSAVNTVWRFYDAIDTYLRTADDTALRDVVDHGFVDHVDEPGTPSDRDALMGYLASLRETHPTLRLVPESVIAQGDRVVALIAPSAAAGGAILGIPLGGAKPWPRVDVVRVSAGRIAERWGDPTGYAPSNTLFSESLTIADPGPRVPVLLRLTFAPGSLEQAVPRRGPAVLFVESGIFDITVDGGISAASPMASGEGGGYVPTEQPTVIGPGDTIVIPDGREFTVANRTEAVAVALLFVLAQPVTNSGGASWAGSEPVLAGIEHQVLAGYTVAIDIGATVTADLALVTLPPGGQLEEHGLRGAELAAVEAGTLSNDHSGGPDQRMET